MVEQYGIFVLLACAALALIAWLALARRGFQQHWGWGVAILLLVGIPFFVVRHFSVAWRPLLVFLVALGGVGATYYVSRLVDLGPRDKIVDGERHLTLTGWDRTDYAILKDKPDTVVLQMANADVTDQTLEHLQGMSQLRELDVSYSQVSDTGLKTLAGLPKLEKVFLRQTAITDQGFRDQLFDKATLLELDVRDTEIASKTMRQWKEQRPEERRFRHSLRQKGPSP